MARLRDIFENFRATAARKRAAAEVQRAERNLVRRLQRWNRKHSDGIIAEDPRRPVNDMNTNQLKAYARELNRVRGKNIRAAGVMSSAGELLPISEYSTYVDLWNKREEEKKEVLKQLKLRGVPQNNKLALVNIDPVTGAISPERGNFVLTLYGEPQIPETREKLQRRIESMKSWKSVNERIDIANNNVAMKLSIISSDLEQAWNDLSLAQKQYLINAEGIFDLMNEFTISSNIYEIEQFKDLDPEQYERSYKNLFDLIRDARQMS